MSATLIIVCGLPGSGKTTHALRLVAQRGGVRLAPDDWTDAPDVNLWRRIQERGREDPPITRSDLDAWSRGFERPTEAEMGLYNT